jgi:hypothetical protein
MGIARQVESLLAEFGIPLHRDDVLVCSSANGGLRVGVVCLTKSYSGAALRNQVLLAGANPVYLKQFDEQPGITPYVDVLIVAGGIDSEAAEPLLSSLNQFDAGVFRYGSLVYAGSSGTLPLFLSRFPKAVSIANPIGEELTGRVPSVFEAVRRAYLDDLVYKEGISELRGSLSHGVMPTPEVVSRGFQRAVMNASSLVLGGASVLLDIGGATTDLHYTVEIVRDDSSWRPTPGTSVARYVFTDLGVVASKETLLLQLRSHPRLYEFLGAVLEGEIRDAYRLLREGEYEPSAELLSYACLFIALDRFAQGQGPGLPTAELSKVTQFVLSGGAAQALSEPKASRLLKLLVPPSSGEPSVMIDRHYRVWVDGITWSRPAVEA